MSSFQFTLIVDGPELQDQPLIDRLFEAGCDDATIGSSDGVQYVDFDREAEALDDAILSAVDDLEKLQGVEVIRIADAGLASLADIAARVGRTRESVRLLVSGTRGPGNFPKPVTDPRSRYRLWRWSDVASWFKEHRGEFPTVADNELTAMYNAALEVRHGRRLLEPSTPISLRELVRRYPTQSLIDTSQRQNERFRHSQTDVTDPDDQAVVVTSSAAPIPETDPTDNCALCNSPMQADSSREHIIPNAIGGRRVVRGFICVDCNSKTGATWDHDLSMQLKPLCVLLNIQRQRGKAQPVSLETVKGDAFLVHPDGRIHVPGTVFSEREQEGKKEINIQVPSMKAMKKMLPGLVRKYPELDIDRLLQHATSRREYMKDPLSIPLTFGGEHAGRSIVKSCLALASEAGLHLSNCEHAQDYLLNDGEPCFGYYNETDVVSNRPDNVFFHCVHVCGDPVSRQVLGYVEYFGFLRIVLCLSSRYDGERFSRSYAVDPVAGKDLNLQVHLAISPEDISAAYSYKKLDFEKFRSAIGILMEYYLEKSISSAISDASADAVEYAFANCGAQPGERLTDEHRQNISRLLIERIEPFLVHLLARPGLTAEDIQDTGGS